MSMPSSAPELPAALRARLHEHLAFIYGAERAGAIYADLAALMQRYQTSFAAAALPHRPPLAERLTQADAVLITYGDQVAAPDETPLHTLATALERYFSGLVTSIHILPFYPYTSDDGFSVVDYKAVDPALGTWEDITRLGQRFRLMFDAVINHISASSAWFQGFLRDEAPYRDYFIVVDPATDLSQVTRPRALPLLTPVETPRGTKHVWTTFSADQIDINYANPEVLLAVIDVLLFYVQQGAEIIRLDAIGYLWKEIGTRCIHLPQTHRVIQLWRDVLDAVAPTTLLITETNVPHRDNISYFGDGSNEAQLVYQFPLAPLVLNAFVAGNAQHLTRWASELEPTSTGTTFFNFLASHDGIGVMPAQGYLSPAEIDQLVQQTLAHGGHVSFKNNPDGSQSPYELNITFFDVLSNPQTSESEELRIDRFIASQAIMLALAGLPGIYIHSMFGSPNDQAGVAATGRNRSINRHKWSQAELEALLADSNGRAAQVLARYAHLLRVRAAEAAFHPLAPQTIVQTNPALFTLLRGELGNQLLCVHNVSDQPQQLTVATTVWGADLRKLRNVVDGTTIAVKPAAELDITVAPYQILWVRPVSEQ